MASGKKPVIAKQTRACTRRHATASACGVPALPAAWKSEDSAFRDDRYEEGLRRGLGRERALRWWALYKGDLEGRREGDVEMKDEGEMKDEDVEMQDIPGEEVGEEHGGGRVERDDPVVVSVEELSAGDRGGRVGGEEREAAAVHETADDEDEWWLDVEGQDDIFIDGEIDLVKAHLYIEEGVGDYMDISDDEWEEIGVGLGGDGGEKREKRDKKEGDKKEGEDGEMRGRMEDAGLV